MGFTDARPLMDGGLTNCEQVRHQLKRFAWKGPWVPGPVGCVRSGDWMPRGLPSAARNTGGSGLWAGRSRRCSPVVRRAPLSGRSWALCTASVRRATFGFGRYFTSRGSMRGYPVVGMRLARVWGHRRELRVVQRVEVWGRAASEKSGFNGLL